MDFPVAQRFARSAKMLRPRRVRTLRLQGRPDISADVVDHRQCGPCVNVSEGVLGRTPLVRPDLLRVALLPALREMGVALAI